MGRLLVLGPERIERELGRIRGQDEADRAWRRRVAIVIVRCATWYFGGLFLIGMSWHVTSYDVARVLYVLGMLAAATGHVFTVLTFWLREI
jgi:hypothetical protein